MGCFRELHLVFVITVTPAPAWIDRRWGNTESCEHPPRATASAVDSPLATLRLLSYSFPPPRRPETSVRSPVVRDFAPAADAASASAVPPSTAPGIVGAYDNHNPDKSKEQLTGYGRRAMLTMNNHAEQFGFFAAAVLFNVACRGPSNGSWEVAGLSLAYAFLRLLHLVFYVTDAAGVRSLAFFVGQLVLFVLWGFVFAA